MFPSLVTAQSQSRPDHGGANERLRPPRYPGEDTTPTRRHEILGWYAYGIAAEVFAVCGVGSFLPVTLEQLARERGTLQTSRLPCVPSVTGAPGGNATSPSIAARDGQQNEQCVVALFGLEVNTASFAMYTFSLAVLVQALTLISFSALADHGNNRKTLLLSFGFVGSITCMLFIFVAPRIYLVGSILVVIGVTCLGSAHVVLNSFLPFLVANDPTLIVSYDEGARELHDLGDWHSAPSTADMGHACPGVERRSPAEEAGFEDKSHSRTSPELQLSTRLSSKGVGLGYAAAVFVQCLSILLLFSLSKTSLAKVSATLPLRFVLLLVGLWWFLFTGVARRWLRNRPGPPLDVTETKGTSAGRVRWPTWVLLVAFAWKSLWRTIKVAVRLRQVVIFLIAWFLLSDAMATVSGTAILFARTELKMSTVAIGVLSIVATTSAVAGAFCWPIISRRLGLKSNHTIIACIALFELIPLYGLLAYIPLFRKWGVIGLQQPWEIFPLAFIHGFVSGGLSSYCRSFFGLLIPPGSEAAFYALYAVTDKGSSFMGPAIVGGLIDATGQVRSGFFFIAILIVMPIPLVWMVDAERGRQDSIMMAEILDKPLKRHQQHMDIEATAADEAEGLLSRD